jgi:hypothetical protein
MNRLKRCTLISPLFTAHTAPKLCAAKCTSANPFVSCDYTLFHFPYPASLLFATLTKTPGVYPNSSHSGTRDASGRATSPIFSRRQSRTPFLSHSSALRIRPRMRIPSESAATDESRDSSPLLFPPPQFPLSPLCSCSCTLFCTFLHSRKTQPFSFHAIPHSLRKTPGWGGGQAPPAALSGFPRTHPLKSPRRKTMHADAQRSEATP